MKPIPEGILERLLSAHSWGVAGRFVRWFTAPGPAAPLAVFRILLCLFCLFKLWMVRGSLHEVYGQYGFVQWAVTRGTLDNALPHVGNLALLLRRFHLSADSTVSLVLGTYCSAIVLLGLGILARPMAALAWAIELILMHSGAGMLYGMDYFTHIGLFYLIVMPSADALSVPSLLGWRNRPVSVAAGVTRRMLQIQLALVYGSSGFEKSLGIQWWNGEAIWRSLTLPVFRTHDFGWLAWVPWLAMLVGWSVLLTEGGYLFAVWSRRTRALWFGMAVGMHLGIGLFMGMWVFSSIMIVLNIGAFGYEAWCDVRLWLAKHRLTLIPRDLLRRLQPAPVPKDLDTPVAS